jgi:hypothetical protein
VKLKGLSAILGMAGIMGKQKGGRNRKTSINRMLAKV